MLSRPPDGPALLPGVAMTLNGLRVECQLRDPCVQCMHGVPHPPLLIAYDETTGNYAYTPERVCMARWASTNGSHKAGSICGAPATHNAGDSDLCQHHFNRACEWRFWEKPLQETEEDTAALRAADARYRETVRESEIHRERIRAERSLVYFIRRTSDGMVKIGYTTAFSARMNAIRGEHGELQVLLTRSGGRELERKMHIRFRQYRIGRSEWFAPVRPLLWWIYRERSDVRWRNNQKDIALRAVEVRKMAEAAPRLRDLTWDAGRIVWPLPVAADPAA